MRIRTKMISILALLFAVLIVLEIAVQKQVLMPSFAELEREDAEASMKRIDYALNMTLDGSGLGQLGGCVSIRAVTECRLRERQHHRCSVETAQSERNADR